MTESIRRLFSEFANGCKYFNINRSSRCGRVAQLGEHLLCKLARQLYAFHRLITFPFIYYNLGHLFFAQKLTPTTKTVRVLTQLATLASSCSGLSGTCFRG